MRRKESKAEIEWQNVRRVWQSEKEIRNGGEWRIQWVTEERNTWRRNES